MGTFKDDAAIELRRGHVARLLTQIARPSVRMIQKALANLPEPIVVSRGTVHRDMLTVRAEWKADRIKSVDEWVERELAKLDQLEQEGWHGLNLSKRPQTKRRDHLVTALDENGQPAGAQTVIESWEDRIPREADPKYITAIVNVMKRRSDMLGLDAAIPLNLSAGGKPMTITVNIGDNVPIDPSKYPAEEDEDDDSRATAEDLMEPAGE